MESKKQLFYKYPNINPNTNKPIVIGSNEYLKLVKKYGEPKIKSPKTGYKISVGKGTYNKLLNEGYTEKELLNPNVVESIQTTITLPDEIILEEILMKNSVKDVLKICKLNKHYNKICQNDKFWEKIYNKYYSDCDINLPTYYDKFKLCHTILARINQFVNTINGYLQDFHYRTIYGSHLHIDIAKKFYYVRGNYTNPSFPKGYTFAIIDQQGNIYSHAGSKVRGNVFSNENGMEAVDLKRMHVKVR